MIMGAIGHAKYTSSKKYSIKEITIQARANSREKISTGLFFIAH